MTRPLRHLLVRRTGAIERVTLNRPDVRNAFNEEVVEEFALWATTAARDKAIRAVVLAGAGTVFCAGADVKWMSKMVSYTREENLRDAAAAADMFDALNTLPFPLIGRIQGAALGGGAGLAAVCDIVVSDEEAVFGFTEVKLGILPAIISPYVTAKIGLSAARELFLTGERFTAQRAREIGLVHRIVHAGGLDESIDAMLEQILTSSPSGIAAAKALLPRLSGSSAAGLRALTSQAIADQRVSAEGQEGLRAFLDKRQPSWIRPLTGEETGQ
jgi:methylglutaconyl-CoA hydratase